MGASVRVEQTALSDPRIEALGQMLGTSRFDALGRLIHLWSHCTEQGSEIVTPVVVIAIFGADGKQQLVDAELAEITEGGLRIRGTKGRIEWLAKKRSAGQKGGRSRWQSDSTPMAAPKQTDGSAIGEVGPRSYPPAPAPAPAPAQEKESVSHNNGQWLSGAEAPGSPPPPEPPSGRAEKARELAQAIAEALNAEEGRRFDPAGKQLLDDCKKLAARGYTPEQARAVVLAKVAEWRDDAKMRKQLKPSVLARPSNFAKYLEEDVGTGKPKAPSNGVVHRRLA